MIKNDNNYRLILMDELFTCAFDSLAPSESGGTADQVSMTWFLEF